MNLSLQKLKMLNSSKKHCILCNVLVEVDDEHINEESHIERLQEAIVKPEEENVTENSETKKTECDAPRETTNIPSNAKVKKRKRKAQLDGRDEKYVKNEKYVKDKKHVKDGGENKYSNEDRDDQDDKDDLDEMDGKENVDGKNDKAGKVVTDCQSCEICKLEKECWDDNDSKVDEEGHDDNDGRIDKDDKETKVDNNGKKDKVLLTESKVATKESGDNCSLPEATQACCDVCNIVMHASNLLAHAAGKRHKNNERHSIHYLMHKSPDEDFFSCEICETHVNLKEIQRHLADSEHTYKYRALLSQNEISKIEDQVLFCDPCLMFMTKGNEVDHVRSNRHKAALKPKVHSCPQSEQVTSMKTEEKEPEISFSAVSSSTRSNNRKLYDPYDQSQERDMDSGDESYMHGRKQSSVSILAQRRKEIMRLRGITGTGEKIQIQDDNVQNNTLEICLVAESSKRIDNKESDRPVKSTVLKVKTKIDKSTCTEIVYDEETENSIRDLKTRVFEVQSKLKEVLYTKPPEQLMEVMYGGSGVACKLCKTILRNDELNIGFHINDLKHKKTESKVYEINKLRKKGDAFYCELCTEDIPAGKQFVHMECDTHKNNFLKEKHQVSNVTAAKCTTHDNNANDVDNDHDKPSTSKNNKSEKCKRYELIHDVKSDELRCQFCEVTVPNTASSINKHIRSFSHYNQKEIFLTVNDIVRNRNLLVCVLCSHEFAETYLFNHVKEEMHLELIGVKKSPETINDFCLICGVSIGEKFNMYDHSITQQHLINYREVMIEERYECEVCNVFMTNNKKRIQKHEAGPHHIKSLKLLNDNSIVIRNGRYSCGLCQEHFLWEEIMDHVTSPKHLSNTSKGM
ncbi:putative leucine-rich repeat-containing protein DDB_G0290503 isoform X2 [Battus philenor]|uniref:putative leucine-rich repeat-containing protein DDB_G0290503 isoform X2 n=1 Tax=Battus philenor TaxID=42288 RepID=UPI0035D054B5